MKEMNQIKTITGRVKADSYRMAALSGDIRNRALGEAAAAIKKNQKQIIQANKSDMEKAISEGLPEPLVKRLKFDEHKIDDVIDGINSLINLDDPLSRTLLKRELDKDLVLHKITCPIGVIGVIFESRPDALVQIAALCLKSGNCAILKGGSEAANTNRILYDIIYEACTAVGIPEGFLTLIENRADID